MADRMRDGQPPVEASTLASRAGSAMAWQAVQLVGVNLLYLARIVVLGRLLAPDDFGLFAVALVAVDFLMSVTDFGMVPALVHRPDARREHYEAAWTIGVVRSLAVGIGLIVLAPTVAALFGEPRAAPLLRVLAVRPLIESFASMGVAELRKELRFRSLAVLKLVEAGVNLAVSVLLVASLGVWALVAGPVAAALAFALLSYALAPMAPRLRFGGTEAGQLARYGRWILISAWAALAGQTLLQLGISRQLGATALGLYFMAGKLALLPINISNQVMAAVALPVFSKVQDDPDLGRQTFRAALVGLATLTVPASLLIFALAPSLAVDVLGNQWVEAVPLIRTLALISVVGLVGDVVVPLLQGSGRPEHSARMDVAQYGILVVAAWLLAGPFGVEGAAAAWLPAVVAAQILGVVYAGKVIDRPLAGLAGPIGAVFAASLLGAAGAWFVDGAIDGFAGPIAGGIVGATIALLAIAVAERTLGLGLRETIGRLFPALARRIR